MFGELIYRKMATFFLTFKCHIKNSTFTLAMYLVSSTALDSFS